MLGLIAGAIAKTIMPGDDPGGIIVTIIIGIVGAIVGGYTASALGIGDQKEFFDIGKPLSPGGFRAYRGWSNIRLAPPRGPCDGSPDRAMVRS